MPNSKCAQHLLGYIKENPRAIKTPSQNCPSQLSDSETPTPRAAMSPWHISPLSYLPLPSLPFLLTLLPGGPQTEANGAFYWWGTFPGIQTYQFCPNKVVCGSAISWSYLFPDQPWNPSNPYRLVFSGIVTDIGELVKRFVNSVATLCPLTVERPSNVSVLPVSSPKFTCLSCHHRTCVAVCWRFNKVMRIVD